MTSSPAAPYRILGELGRGAMGVVYRAHDVAAGREVALKLILAGDAARLAREGQVTAGLDHPGIVTIHQAGVLEGRPFLAYALVPGARTLSEVFRTAPQRERVRLLRDAALALGYAHRRGVVHRDVKPGNVLVDAQGLVRVSDFGLAAATGLERLTVTGAVVGTPSYMPPEALSGLRAEPSPAADVWALGVMLYEALADELPFAGQSLLELAAQVASSEPPPFARARAVPAALDAACRRALRKEPAERFPDGDAFAEALDAWLEGRAPQGTSRAAGRGVAALVALVAVVAVAGAFAVAVGGRDEAPATGRVAGPPAHAKPPAASHRSATHDDGSWGEVTRLRDPQARIQAMRAWLAEHPGHSSVEAARARLSAEAARAPVAILQHALDPDVEVYVVALADGRLVTVGADRRLVVWDPRRFEALATWSTPGEGGLDGAVAWGAGLAVAVNRDVHWVEAVTADAPPEWRGLKALEAGDAETLTASPDGRLLAAAYSSGLVRVIEPAANHYVAELRCGEKAFAVAFSLDGRRLYTAAGPEVRKTLVAEGEVAAWDTATWKRVITVRTPGQPLGLAVHASGDPVFAGSVVGHLSRYSAELAHLGDLARPEEHAASGDLADTFSFMRRGSAHQGAVRALVMTSGRLVSGTWGEGGAVPPGELGWWDLATGRSLALRSDLPGRVSSLIVLPSGDALVGMRAGIAQVWAPPAE